MDINQGRLCKQKFVASEFFDARPSNITPSLLVVHNISLPPNQFGGDHIEALFTGKLDPNEHPFFKEIAHLRVSAHCLIRRDGEIIQFVNFNERAWHAGVSSFQGNVGCNDYSIGIELEGTDTQAFTQIQYQKLIELTCVIMRHYPAITLGRIVGHNDIAFGRKTDPGIAFDWCVFRQELVTLRNANNKL